MINSHDLENFKGLDRLIKKDYIDGTDDRSEAILDKAAGFLIENSTIIKRNPFKNLLLVENEKINGNLNGITKFLEGLDSFSLMYLAGGISSDIYIFDDKEYSILTIEQGLNKGKPTYSWRKTSLNSAEIDLVENIVKESGDAAYEKIERANQLYKVADYKMLAYKIKKNSKYFNDYDSEIANFYLVEDKNVLGKKNLLELSEDELSGLSERMPDTNLFIRDKDEVYSIKEENKKFVIYKLKKENYNDGVMLGIINHKGYENMYE